MNVGLKRSKTPNKNIFPFSIYLQPLLTTIPQQHTNTISTIFTSTIITAQTDVVSETSKITQTPPTFIMRFTIDKGQAIGRYLVEGLRMQVEEVVMGVIATMHLDHP